MSAPAASMSGRNGCRLPQVGGQVAEPRTRCQLRAQALAHRVEIVRAPGLVRVVSGVVVDEDVGAEPCELRRDGVADAPPA